MSARIEERKIYEKLLAQSELAEAPCAPDTLEFLSRFSVLSRLKTHENSSLYSKLRVYDGENLKDTDPQAKSVQEYRDAAGVNEGMTEFLRGLRIRFFPRRSTSITLKWRPIPST